MYIAWSPGFGRPGVDEGVAGAACRSLNNQNTVDPRKLEHGFRRNSAGIPYTLP